MAAAYRVVSKLLSKMGTSGSGSGSVYTAMQLGLLLDSLSWNRAWTVG